MAVADELVKIAKRYELLKRKYLHKGVINKELHKKIMNYKVKIFV